MASLVNPSNINGNFPIAGQDNDSQGFRDNFTNIRNNFTFIKSEVEDLQAKAVLKSALIGTTLNNDFQGSKVRNLQVSNLTETVKDIGAITGNELALDLSEGNIVRFTAPTTGDVKIADVIKNWPASLQHSRILLYVTVNATAFTMTLPAGWTTDLSSVPGLRRVDGDAVISYTDPGDYIYEIASPDSGNTVYFRELTTGNAIFRDPNFYMVGMGIGKANEVPLRTGYESVTLMIGFGDYLGGATTNIGVGYRIDSLKTGNDSLMVKGSITSYQNSLDANLTAGLDSLTSAGFSVVQDRSIVANTVLSLGNTVSGDLIGYYNAIGYTYNNIGATSLAYQQLGAIQFVARGTTNSPLGLGGEIQIKTKGDGTVDGLMPNAVVGGHNYNLTRGQLRTAVTIDNKQNVTVHGNLTVLGQTTAPDNFKLTAAGTGITATTTGSNYFGANSNPVLTGSAVYEIEVDAYFEKTTATTAIWFFNFTGAAPTAYNVEYSMSPVTGIVAPPGNTSMLQGQAYNQTTQTFSVTTATLTTGVNHYAHFRFFVVAAAGTTGMQIQVYNGASGTITPGIGSRWKITRLPAVNENTYAA